VRVKPRPGAPGPLARASSRKPIPGRRLRAPTPDDQDEHQFARLDQPCRSIGDTGGDGAREGDRPPPAANFGIVCAQAGRGSACRLRPPPPGAPPALRARQRPRTHHGAGRGAPFARSRSPPTSPTCGSFRGVLPPNPRAVGSRRMRELLEAPARPSILSYATARRWSAVSDRGALAASARGDLVIRSAGFSQSPRGGRPDRGAEGEDPRGDPIQPLRQSDPRQALPGQRDRFPQQRENNANDPRPITGFLDRHAFRISRSSNPAPDWSLPAAGYRQTIYMLE